MITNVFNKRNAFSATILLIAIACGMLLNGDTGEIPTEYIYIYIYIYGIYTIDVYNPYELVGDTQYVFVATIEEAHMEYRDPVGKENEFGIKVTLTVPYTSYTVKILENIKGELIIDKPIPLLKRGGITEDRKAYFIFEDDFLPKVGETVIFLAYASRDGSLLVSGPNSTHKIGTATLNNSSDFIKAIKESPEYKKILHAYENQITENPRLINGRSYFNCIYDIKYNSNGLNIQN